MTAFTVMGAGFKAAYFTRRVELPVKLFFLTWLPRILLQTLFFGMIALYAGGPPLLRFALVGNAIQIAAIPATVLVTSFLVAHREEGMLTWIITTPCRLAGIIIGHCLYFALEGLASSVLIVLVIWPYLGLHVTGTVLAAVFGITCLVSVSLTGLGLAVGSIVFRGRWDMPIAGSISYILAILAGVNVPLDILPGFIQWFSRLLPLTNGLEAIRNLLAANGPVMSLIVREVAAGVLCWSVGLLLFTINLAQGRARGNLERF